MDLNTPIEYLGGIGKTISARLKKLGIENVGDILFYLPFRHEDYSKSKKIGELKLGEKANILSQIELIENRRAWRRRKMNITEALVSDRTGSLKITWFNQPFITKILEPGDRVSLAGKIEQDKLGLFAMNSPIYEKIDKDEDARPMGLLPNYHLTQNLTQKQVRTLVKQIIGLAQTVDDFLPSDIKQSKNLLDLNKAITLMHFPEKTEDILEARRRLAFDELFLIQLKSNLIKKQRDRAGAPKIFFREKETREFISGMPFKLTNAQKKVSWEILKEMQSSRPMARLLNGDVGSGKTMVANIALFNTVLNKSLQAALMVPTEILARQHFLSISAVFANYPIKIALFTNTQRQVNNGDVLTKKKMLDSIAKGEIDIVIGTHSLLQDKLKFKNLALVVIDEQHRFGVAQRKTLLEKNTDKNITPHFLSMTATPIPRSLALTIFGDLDISVIDEMPIGRKKVITKFVPEHNRKKVYGFIKGEIAKGRQAFVVCPLIEESDFLGVKSVELEYQKLNEVVFPEIKIGVLHGKMKAKEKEQVMKDFLDKKYMILVSTSVIEVGVDVPNATIVLIEGAERFGLAQLHQFRGRVGRGDHQSYCALFSNSKSENSINRLKKMEEISDGFALSQADLKFRGAGQVFGTQQNGFPEFKIATLFDHHLMKDAQEEAIKLLKDDPDLKNHPNIKSKIIRELKETHLE